jgi:hypothetical protein
MNYHYILGHACTHNLMCVDSNYESDPYSQLLNTKSSRSSNSIVWGIHPFSKHWGKDYRQDNNYQLACEDYGYPLLAVRHPWCKLSRAELWTVCGSFHWVEHDTALRNVGEGVAADLLDSRSTEHQIYTRLFSSHWTFDQYLEHCGLGRS